MAGERLGEVRLRDVVERDPLGTAGGVRNAADLVDGRVVVMNGDVLTELDLTAMLRRARGPRRGGDDLPHARREPHGLRPRRARARRPRAALPGEARLGRGHDEHRQRGRLRARARAPRVDPEGGGRTRWSASSSRCSSSGGVPFYGFVSPGYWVDIGTPVKYFQAQQDLLARRFRAHVAPAGREGPEGWIHPTATIAPSARVRGPVVIGAGCRVEAGAVGGARASSSAPAAGSGQAPSSTRRCCGRRSRSGRPRGSRGVSSGGACRSAPTPASRPAPSWATARASATTPASPGTR